MYKILGLFLCINIILFAEPISFDNNISKGNSDRNNSQKSLNKNYKKKCHRTLGRYNTLYDKCTKKFDDNLTF